MSIDDRDYFRASPEPRRLDMPIPVKWIVVAATTAAFLGQKAIENGVPFDGERFLLSHVALTLEGVLRGELWQLLTYLLLHGDVAHVVLNMAAFFVFATVLREKVPDASLARLYLLGGVAGAAGCLLWSAANLPGGSLPVVGASGAVTAVLVGAALRAPEKRIAILTAEVPVWFLGTLFVGVDLLTGVAHALKPDWIGEVAVQAHLGGAAAGMAAARLGLLGGRRRAPSPGRTVPCPDCGKPVARGAGVCARCGWEREGATVPEADAARMDALLERIHESGIGSLTPEERDFLNRQASRYRDRRP